MGATTNKYSDCTFYQWRCIRQVTMADRIHDITAPSISSLKLTSATASIPSWEG